MLALEEATRSRSGLPDPIEPGRFGLDDFGAEAMYKSRWAGHREVVDLILAGRYESLTPIVSELIPTLKRLALDGTRAAVSAAREPAAAVDNGQLRSGVESGPLHLR